MSNLAKMVAKGVFTIANRKIVVMIPNIFYPVYKEKNDKIYIRFPTIIIIVISWNMSRYFQLL